MYVKVRESDLVFAGIATAVIVYALTFAVIILAYAVVSMTPGKPVPKALVWFGDAMKKAGSVFSEG